jgi:hypothetical protein
MSAWKPLALGLLICGVMGRSVHADPITWPSGLDNWLIYLAAPSGNPGNGPVSYSVPNPPVVPPQPVSSPPQPAPVQPAAYNPPAAPQPAPVQPVTYTPPAASQPAPVQLVAYTPPAAPQPAPVQPAAYTPPVTSQPATAQPVTYTPPSASQPSMVQAVTYIPPASTQPASVQPVTYTPPTILANAPVSVAQQAVVTPSMSGVSSTAPTASAPVQGFINLGNGPYPQAAAITTGGALPWYNSTQVASLFGGQPTAQQIQSFDNTILQRVQQSFSQSGISVTLTDNPNVAALHTISLVSNTASATLSSAIGMTQVGSNGFSFIDHIAPSAQSLDQLEWIVAHNVSHELMLAFGVPENYDKTGNFIDSKLANWSMMVNSSSTFSPAASQAIAQALASQSQSASGNQLGAQEYNPSPAPIPEPTTVALWGLAAVAFAVSRRRPWRRRRITRPV